MGRRPLPPELKRKPQDYPRVDFRVPRENKARLERAIRDAERIMEKRKKIQEPSLMKGDVLFEALEIGLAVLKKKHL